MKKFIGIVLVLCSLALPLAGCKEAISTVTCNTISELEDIPGQILSTPESAETEPEYNYIHFRYDNIWTVSALVNYEIVDNGQNIKKRRDYHSPRQGTRGTVGDSQRQVPA